MLPSRKNEKERKRKEKNTYIYPAIPGHWILQGIKGRFNLTYVLTVPNKKDVVSRGGRYPRAGCLVGLEQGGRS